MGLHSNPVRPNSGCRRFVPLNGFGGRRLDGLAGAEHRGSRSDWGSFYDVTTRLAWTPTPNVHLRPELRYDIHSGPGRDAYAEGKHGKQQQLAWAHQHGCAWRRRLFSSQGTSQQHSRPNACRFTRPWRFAITPRLS
ncbi:MAG: hypothetical protein ACOH2P_24305 [Pseudomonas sp.]